MSIAKNVTKYGLLPVASVALLSSAAHAEGNGIDVSGTVNTLVSDGTTAITAVGVGLLTLAGVAIVFKWVKAAFFS